MAVSLPQAFVESTRAALGDKADAVVEAIRAGESVTAVRANPFKISADDLRRRFAAAGEDVPWCADAFYLNERPVFSLDPLIHAGAYYVQDPSAMFVGSLAEVLIRQSEASLKVLDLCAAPGGKSTAVASALRPSDLLVSNEVIGSRASVLAENMVKWGCPNTVVTNNDPKDFARLAASFDIILADVPCSGEGMFRKDLGAVAEWSPENVNLCAARQRRIVADVWPSLREGGWLIYSTCTFNSSENDDNVEWICSELGAEPVALLRAMSAPGQGEQCVSTRCGLQFAPGITRGEGQYVAVLRKTSSAKPASFKPAKPLRKAPCNWLMDGFNSFSVETSAGTLIKAYPQALVQDIRQFEERLKVLRSGVAVATVKGRDLIPQTDLALSQAFRQDAFQQVELAKDQALQYLRCEALQLPDAPKGFLTVTCEGLPLGFVKNLGNRANNLFPQAWRLRMNC
ncbi:MAG: rRNA cytosine-C5-methyltransferase [Bacteroidales bacterium]|nr:rRNA cytosine-C5-methyltransferase [Bacteroidales bacterium]